MSLFWQEVHMLHGGALDELSSTWWGERNGRALPFLDLPLNLWISFVQYTHYHEYGHFNRYKAFGYNPSFGKSGKYRNAFQYMGYIFTHPFKEGVTQRGEKLWPAEGARVLESPQIDEAILCSAAGVNNTMRFAGDLGDRAYNNKGHSSEFFSYTFSKLGPLFYQHRLRSEKDLAALVNFYRSKGVSISTGKMHTALILSYILSASTYSYASSFSYGSLPIEQDVRPLEWGGVRIPDVESYLVADGLSYKVKSGIRFTHSFHLPVSIEFVREGKKGIEVTVGLYKLFESLRGVAVSGNILVGKKLGWNASLYLPVTPYAFVEGVAEKMDIASYYGQRNIPTLKTSRASYSFLLRAGLCY